MREPLFRGEAKWERRHRAGLGAMRPQGWLPRGGGESPLDHLAWAGGKGSAGLAVKLHWKCLHPGSGWSPP